MAAHPAKGAASQAAAGRRPAECRDLGQVPSGGAILAISTSTRSSISASTPSSRGVAGARPCRWAAAALSCCRVAGVEVAAQQPDLELVERVERGPAPLDRVAPPLGRRPRSPAVRSERRCRRPCAAAATPLAAAGRLALGDAEAAAAVRRAGGRGCRDRGGAVRSVDPHGEGPCRMVPGYRQRWRRLWLMAGKRPGKICRTRQVRACRAPARSRRLAENHRLFNRFARRAARWHGVR